MKLFADIPERERLRVGAAVAIVLVLFALFVWGILTGRIRFGAAAAVLSFVPSSSQINVNGAGPLELRLDTGGNDVVSTTAIVIYDPTLLEAVTVDTANSVFPYDINQDLTAGRIEISRGIPGNKVISDGVGFRGNAGVVASITFKGLRSGTATVSYNSASLVILDDGAGGTSPLTRSSGTITITTPDTTPPANVTNLTATPGDASVLLAWTNPRDSDLRGVRIQRKTGSPVTGPTDGTTVFDDATAVPSAALSYDDRGLTNGTTYYYGVFAYDQAGNFSSGVGVSSTPIRPTGDTVAPGRITDSTVTSQLTKAPQGRKIQYTLHWTATGDDGTQGTAARYIVYYSKTPSGDKLPADVKVYQQNLSPKLAGSAESLVFDVKPAPSAQKVYYVAIIAIDEAGNRGPLSNVVSTQ